MWANLYICGAWFQKLKVGFGCGGDWYITSKERMSDLHGLSSIVISFINEGNLKTYDFIERNIPELIWHLSKYRAFIDNIEFNITFNIWRGGYFIHKYIDFGIDGVLIDDFVSDLKSLSDEILYVYMDQLEIDDVNLIEF